MIRHKYEIKKTCDYYSSCCDCGGHDCGCNGCFSCQACEECRADNSENCTNAESETVNGYQDSWGHIYATKVAAEKSLTDKIERRLFLIKKGEPEKHGKTIADWQRQLSELQADLKELEWL